MQCQPPICKIQLDLLQIKKSSFDFKPSHVFVSYDVVSLFTNIPMNETIDIVCNYVYQQHSPPKHSKETFKKLLQIATGGYFIQRQTMLSI